MLPKSYEGAHFLSPLPIAAILVKHMNQYISADGQVNTPLCCCNLHTGGLLTSSLPEPLSCLGSQDTCSPVSFLPSNYSSLPILKHWCSSASVHSPVLPLGLWTWWWWAYPPETSLPSHGHAWLQMSPTQTLSWARGVTPNKWSDMVEARNLGANVCSSLQRQFSLLILPSDVSWIPWGSPRPPPVWFMERLFHPAWL